MPSWSRDGRFLYFVSNRTGRDEIWRVAVGGGTEEQITREGGSGPPLESFDGRTLYYQRPSDSALVARPTAGGRERTVLRCVDLGNYAGALAEVLRTPRYATAMGLVYEGVAQREQGKLSRQSGSVKAVLGRMREWFQRNF